VRIKSAAHDMSVRDVRIATSISQEHPC
jgi:hypothetical protein